MRIRWFIFCFSIFLFFNCINVNLYFEAHVIIKNRGLLVGCFGRNPDGSPRHPSYLLRYSQDDRNRQHPIIEFPLTEYLQSIAQDAKALQVRDMFKYGTRKCSAKSSVLDWTLLWQRLYFSCAIPRLLRMLYSTTTTKNRPSFIGAQSRFLQHFLSLRIRSF